MVGEANERGLASEVAALGAVLGRDVHDATLRLFAAGRHAADDQAGVHRDLQYGPHPRQRLTVFASPHRDNGSLPVLVFVHGGGFVQGDTVLPGTPFFDNIGEFAGEADMVGVNLTYRLSPEARWPSASTDIGTALSWIAREIDLYGGDPSNIILMGTSAGAMAILDGLHEFARIAEARVAAVILRSAIYDLSLLREGPLKEALTLYYGEDEALWLSRHDPAALSRATVPVLLTVGQFDPPALHEQARIGFGHLLQGAEAHRFALLVGHNHYSVDFAAGSHDRSVDDAMMAFLREAGILQ